MKKQKLLILMWHQVYLSTKAGGYIRLIEFLKRIPDDINFILLDNKPTIFKNIIPKKILTEYSTPLLLEKIRGKSFLLWGFLEVLVSSYILYKQAQKIIINESVKVLYVPIGEFPQLYIPAILLKMKFPSLYLVVDILNYELPQENAYLYFKQLREGKVSLIKSLVIVSMYYLGYFITNISIRNVDYIFTVSERLVKKIKEKYKKSSIDFTPSGVYVDKTLKFSANKKYDAVFVGRITIQKGIYELLQVWKKVIKEKPNAILAVVGYADKQLEEEINKEIINSKLQKNIILFGGVTENQKKKILSQSKLFLHLAKYEPLFPVIGILEGLSFGMPVIIYDMDVTPQDIRKSKMNFIFNIPNGDQKKVAQKVIDFLNAKNLSKEVVFKNARSYAMKYDWDIIAKKEFKVITEFLQKG